MNNEYGMKLKELHDIYESKYVKLEKELKEKNKLIEELKIEVEMLMTKPEHGDTCQTCGCNEFLCGHNKKG